MKILLILVALCGMTGCGTDAPINGKVVVHITDAGIIASCESSTEHLDTGSMVPATCSPIQVTDERSKGGTK